MATIWVVLGHDLGGNGGTGIVGDGVYSTEDAANEKAAELKAIYMEKGGKFYSEWSSVWVEEHDILTPDKGNKT